MIISIGLTQGLNCRSACDGSHCALVFAGWPVWRHEMQHATKSRTGRSISRTRRNHCRHKRKRVFVATLLTVAVGVQLVTVGRYTVLYIFLGPSTANKYSPKTVWIIEEDPDNKTKPLFQLISDDSTPILSLRNVNNWTCFVEGVETSNSFILKDSYCI